MQTLWLKVQRLGCRSYGKYGIEPLCLRYPEHISCFMYRQSKRAGIIDFVRPPMNLLGSKNVKFKKGTKYRYAMHLKSPRVHAWSMGYVARNCAEGHHSGEIQAANQENL